VRYAGLGISSDFERTQIYCIVSYRRSTVWRELINKHNIPRFRAMRRSAKKYASIQSYQLIVTQITK